MVEASSLARSRRGEGHVTELGRRRGASAGNGACPRALVIAERVHRVQRVPHRHRHLVRRTELGERHEGHRHCAPWTSGCTEARSRASRRHAGHDDGRAEVERTATRTDVVVARRRVVTALTIVASVLVADVAHAEDKTANAAAAQHLFDEAIKLMDAGSYAEACPKLARSQELAPSGGTLLNLGDCYEKNGQTASAWVSFRDAAARAATAGQKPAQAAALVRADALAPKLLHLTMKLAPGARVPGLEIKRDGEPVSNAELGIDVPVDAGLHKIEATAPGHLPWSKNVGVVQGTVTEPIVIPALERRPEAPAGSVTDPNLGSSQRTIGLVVAGGGLLAAGIGAVYGLKAFSTNDDALAHCRDAADAKRCDPTGLSLTDEARTQATLSTVLVALGGVALAGGLVLYVIAPRAQPTVGRLRVIPYGTASSGGLSAHTAW